MLKSWLFAATLVLFWASCQSNNKAEAVKTPEQKDTTSAVQRKTIVFFGNSLTAAYQLSPEQGFTHLLQRKIDSLGMAYNCVNAGLSGETTADGKNRIEWVLQQPMDIFLLELGGNDALRGLPVESSKQNLQAIIDQVRTKYPSCKILIAGMLAPPNLGDRYTKAFKSMFADLAKKNNTDLIPFLLEGVGGVPALNLEDGIHPNPSGQKIVAETVWKYLEPML